jgi:primosomal protein N'
MVAEATVGCPHCKTPVTATVGELSRCPSCGGELRVHLPGANEPDEALRRLLSTVKIVERVGDKSGTQPESGARTKRPWWKFWG